MKTALNKAVKNDIVIALGKGREDYQEMNDKIIKAIIKNAKTFIPHNFRDKCWGYVI